MSKRFTETEIWSEDWFIETPKEYKLFYFYLKDQCNHAGIWRPNLRIFEAINEVKIDLKKAIEYFNKDKVRVQILNSGHWYLLDFFVFQYGGVFNSANRVHKSIEIIYNKEDIVLTSIRGLLDLKDRVKDKDIDKDILINKGAEKNKEINIPFDIFWNLYDKKKGSKDSCEKIWNKLNDETRKKIIDTLPKFKASITDKQFQPFPQTYLNQKRWNDEIKENSVIPSFGIPGQDITKIR